MSQCGMDNSRKSRRNFKKVTNQKLMSIKKHNKTDKNPISIQAIGSFLLDQQQFLKNHSISIKENCKKAVSWSWEMFGTLVFMVETFNGVKEKLQFCLQKVDTIQSEQSKLCKGDNNIEKDLGKINEEYILVLDLDETLIHSDTKRNTPEDFEIEIDQGDEIEFYYVRKRPYLTWFLDQMSKIFELVIFTASVQEYADKVINYIDPKGLIKRRFYRNSCTKQNGLYNKDLNKISQDKQKIFIIDNSVSGFSINPDNGMLIKSWYSDGGDRELKTYGEFLSKFIRYFKQKNGDVREMIKLLKKKFPKHIIN